jgi:Tol biopolymer transport system component
MVNNWEKLVRRSIAEFAGRSASMLMVVFLAASCGDDTGPSGPGSLLTTAASTGSDVDPDGYMVSVDGGAQLQPVDANGSVTIQGLTAGTHSVELTEVASNCSVGGENPRSVSVAAGGTAATTFVVTCAAVTGDARITTETNGSEIDPDGYSLLVDGAAGPSIGTDETLDLMNLAAGDHQLELADVEGNCSVAGANPRIVTVPAGGQAATTFSVTCSATTGSIEATTSTSGPDPDPDGYTVTVDGGTPEPVGVNGTVTIPGVSAGDRSVELGDVAGNCSVTGDNPRSVTVVAGETAATTFEVTCAEQVGNVELTTVTWGLNTDNAYTMNVDGVSQGTISGNDTETLTAVPTGARQVSLSGVRSNCAVQGDNPRTVTVAEGQTAQTTFDVFCFQPLSNKIAFESGRDGNSEIYVMNTDGSGQVNLTLDPDEDKEPDVAPDGSAVVFESDRAGGNRDVWIMENGGFRNLTDSGAQERSPSFSGAGDQVAYARKSSSSTWSIWSISTSGGGAIALTDDAGDDDQPAWSADGSRILFRSDRDGQGHYDLYVMDSDGQNVTRLTTDGGEDGKPAWSSSGTEITWSTDRAGSFDVWRADYDPGTRTLSNLENITTGSPGVDGKSDWRPGQSTVAYATDNDGDNEIWVMNSDGSGKQKVTNNSIEDLEPSWSP